MKHVIIPQKKWSRQGHRTCLCFALLTWYLTHMVNLLNHKFLLEKEKIFKFETFFYKYY